MKNFIFSLCFLLSFKCSAIINYDSGDPAYNTQPTPEIESAWNLVGKFGSFTGIPISPTHFLAAAHVGGGSGSIINFQGINYSVLSSFTDPASSDLKIHKINGSFPSFAQLYINNDETGKLALLVGRGTRRGSEMVAKCIITNYLEEVEYICTTNLVFKKKGKSGNGGWIEQIKCNYYTNYTYLNTETNSHLAGWTWGAGDGIQRWGTNVVQSIGSLIAFDFLPNTCAVSGGDSSGAVFVQDQGAWKLAAVISYVGGQGPFSTYQGGPAYSGAYFDAGGLWSGASQLNCEQKYSTFSYGTRIFPRLEWVNSVLLQ